MSDDYYSTRLRWTNGRGAAKLRGKRIVLTEPPVLAGQPVDGIDYTPEMGVFRVQRRFEGWSDMRDVEIAAADAFLQEIVK